jgi:hypothetical protein
VVGVRAVAAICVLLTGCFYIDPILARPHYHIVAPDMVYRGGPVFLTAQLIDTETQAGSFDWKVYGCAGFDHGVASHCDGTPFYPASGARVADSTSSVRVMVPAATMSGAMTQAIQITLEARSDRGAVALPDGSNQEFAVGDAPPVVQLDRQSHSLAVGGPIDVIATYSDIDSALDQIALAWSVVGPGPTGSYSLDDLAVAQDPGDPGHRKAGKRLTPNVEGSWDVQVIARDQEGGSTTQQLTPFMVVPDQPPCLAQWLPAVPPAGATLPISTQTVFQVPLVDDDLDPYPPITEVPRLLFAWSILRPGETQREVQVGATGNAFALDPAAFTPGDVVELRVEIFDRRRTALPCDAAAATCSIASSGSCLQRQTWRVEIR